MFFPFLLLDLKNLAIIFVTALHAALGIVIPLRGPVRRQNITFGLLELSLIAWSVSMVFYRSSSGREAILWAELLYASAMFIPYTFIYFLYTFPEDKLAKMPGWLHGVLLAPVLFFLWTVLDGRLIVDVIGTKPEPTIIFNERLEYFYAAYIVVFFSWSYLKLFSFYFRSSGITKIQVRYVLLGTLASTLLATPPNLFLPLGGIFAFNWLGQVVIVIMAVAIAYAISRYSLLNVKVIATEIFTVLINILILLRLVGSGSLQDIVLNGFLFIGVAVFSIMLVKSVLGEVRQREEVSRLAESLRKANQELKKLDQLKSEFLSLASHQLRTPLSIIKGYISMLQEGSFGAVSEKVRDVLRKVYFSNERLINLVNDFLNLSRIESGRMRYEFEAARIEDVVEAAVEEFTEAAKGRNIELIWKRPPEILPEVMLDKEKFHQVIMNIIDNSLKYTREGRVEISVGQEQLRAGVPWVIIAVKDTGIGMNREEIDSIFKRFSRGSGGSKVNTEGTGLGLYLAKRIVSDHGGEIRAQSKGPGTGSSFFIRLPARAAQVKRSEQFKELVAKI